MATKKKELAGAPKALKQPTLIHIAYHPEEGIVNASVQQDVTILDQTSRHGSDARIATSDLSADIRKHLEVAFKGIADHVGATPAKEV